MTSTHIRESPRVGIYIGLAGEPTSNIESALAAWGHFLEDVPWSIETFGSADPLLSATAQFQHISTTDRSYRTPFDKIFAVANDCREYVNRRAPNLIIQFWQTQTNAPGAILAGRLTNTPVVARFVGDLFREYTDFTGLERCGVYLLANLICARSLRYADQVIAFGPYGESELVKHGINPDSIRRLPPTLSPESYFEQVSDQETLRQRLDLPTDRSIAFYAGRLTDHKGMDFLADVIDATERSDLLFVLAGSGPFRERFTSRYDSSRVRCVGHVDHDRIHKYYQAADVYVQASRFEGIPLSILEAIDCELPVVARGAGDIPIVTSNIVDTAEEMASMLETKSWTSEYPDRTIFEAPYQERVLRDIIQESY